MPFTRMSIIFYSPISQKASGINVFLAVPFFSLVQTANTLPNKINLQSDTYAYFHLYSTYDPQNGVPVAFVIRPYILYAQGLNHLLSCPSSAALGLHPFGIVDTSLTHQ